MKAWSRLCGSAAVLILCTLFVLSGSSEIGLGVLALGALSMWFAERTRWPALSLAVIVGGAALAALNGRPIPPLILIVVLALMGHEFSLCRIRYQNISEVRADLTAMHGRRVLDMGLLAALGGGAGLAWQVHLGFWWSLTLALVLMATLGWMLKHRA